MKLIFLGTSAMVPTKDRNTIGLLIRHENENILVDCGEGIQRQLMKVKIFPTKITKILITHWHGDHILGLPGLLQTLSCIESDKIIDVYGPTGTKAFIKKMLNLFVERARIKVKTHEIKKSGIFLETRNFFISAEKLKHHTRCLGYSIIEKDKRKINIKYTKKFGLTKHPLLGKLQKGKTVVYKGKKISPNKATTLVKGKKISIILDTGFCKNAIKIAKNSDLLVCESTFLNDFKNLAKEYKHLTAEEAALIAKKANVKKLILTHFSQRYKDVKKIKKEASKIFKNVSCSKDLDIISL
jgi:ribonuclease Z